MEPKLSFRTASGGEVACSAERVTGFVVNSNSMEQTPSQANKK